MTMNKTRAALVSSVISLILCFSMLLGTTFAWFTDEATSTGNIIASGTLNIELNKSEDGGSSWTDASTGAIFDYKHWEPGYTQVEYIQVKNAGNLALKYNLNVVPVSATTGEYNLADVIDVYIGEMGSGFTAPTAFSQVMQGMTKVGTLADLMADPDGAAYGVLLPAESVRAPKVELSDADKAIAETGSVEYCIMLHMQESAGNDYQNLSVGDGFTVQLKATQYTYEHDSFDNQYDVDTESPIANVNSYTNREINATWGMGGDAEPMTLDAAFQFQPTETEEEVANSPYKYWHADFVVSANKGVPANSVALAGYYSLWCEGVNDGNWVALTSDATIEAGQEIRLVQSMGGESISVNYEELCRYGNDGIGFLCGAKDLNGSNVGTTLTVELRLYETEEPSVENGNSHNKETGNYIVVGSYQHTFGAFTATTSAELATAINNGVTEINLAEGTYTMPAAAKGKTLTINGAENTVIEHVNQGEDGMNYGLEGSTVTFNGVTIKTTSGTYRGFARSTAIEYNDCHFVGSYTLGAGSHTFNNCYFNLQSNYVWTWGGTKVIFDGCTFEDENGIAKAILVHNTADTEVTVKDCTFIATTGAQTWDGINVAAVSIDPNGQHTAKVTFEGSNSVDSAFNGKWQIKYKEDTALVTVVE